MFSIRLSKLDIPLEFLKHFQYTSDSSKNGIISITISSFDHDKIREMYRICVDYNEAFFEKFAIGVHIVHKKVRFVFHEENYIQGMLDRKKSELVFYLYPE